MVAKKNSVDINFNDVRTHAKALGINVVGKKRARAVEMVLDAIVAGYDKKKEDLAKAEFQEYKKKNSTLLNWYNKFKDWEETPETIAEETEAEKTEEAPEGKVDEEPEKKDKKGKDLSGTKGRVKKAKADVKKKVESKKETGEASYIPRYRKQIANSNTVPGKIREYIQKKRKVSFQNLLKECARFGASPKSGGISATVRILELDRKIKVEGKGEGRMLIHLEK